MNDQDIVCHYFPDYFDCLNLCKMTNGQVTYKLRFNQKYKNKFLVKKIDIESKD